MTRSRMHSEEIDVDPVLVRRLIAGQFPQWIDLPIEPVPSYGTDHHIYRLGEQLAIRLPRIEWAVSQAAKEAEWLPKLAPHLPLTVPAIQALGRPAEGYPFAWSVVTWLPGEDANRASLNLEQAADDLASFIRALREVETTGSPPRQRGARGSPLIELDQAVRRGIALLGDRIRAEAVLRCWEESVEALAWDGPDRWVHGDLLPGNLLVVDGRISAVIDFGGLNASDPACDLLPAWNLFEGRSRTRFRSQLQVDDASWLRGRGWALAQAVIALPYYWDTNKLIVRQALRALEQVLN